MMTRADIKIRAKGILRQNYSMSLVPILIYIAISALAATVTFGLGFIITLPLAVGMQLIYIMLWRDEHPSFELMFQSAFSENFGRKLGGMLLVSVFTFLWSLLFVIPGIVKMYSYAMTPYILAKYPNVEAMQAINISQRIMRGRKLELFVVELSFLGWQLLSVLTLGILNILYVTPYIFITKAGCFDIYLADAIERGAVDRAELRETV